MPAEVPKTEETSEITKEQVDTLRKEFESGSISKKKYEILEDHFTPKERVDSLLEDMKSSRELARSVGDNEKIPTEERMKERLKGISGSEFLNYSSKDLQLLFLEGDTVNFYGNNSAYRAIGAGNLFDRSTEYVKINGIVGKRSQYEGAGYLNGKVGYVTANGGYLAIDTDVTIEFDVKAEEQKGFEEIQTLSGEEEIKAKTEFRNNFEENEKIVNDAPILNKGKEVEYPDGTIKVGGSRSWRNNNPGNLEYGRFAKRKGAIGTDGRFAIFPTEEIGHNAKVSLLKSSSYINKTIKGAILKYAPSFENNSTGYANTIAVDAGVSTDTRLSSLTDDQFDKLDKSMTKVEGWSPGRMKINNILNLK